MIAIAFGVGLIFAYGSVLLLIVMLPGGNKERVSLPPTRREPPPMPSARPPREQTDWDVAEASAEQEPTPPYYMYDQRGDGE
jgi:hypothetical protein